MTMRIIRQKIRATAATRVRPAQTRADNVQRIVTPDQGLAREFGAAFRSGGFALSLPMLSGERASHSRDQRQTMPMPFSRMVIAE